MIQVKIIIKPLIRFNFYCFIEFRFQLMAYDSKVSVFCGVTYDNLFFFLDKFIIEGLVKILSREEVNDFLVSLTWSGLVCVRLSNIKMLAPEVSPARQLRS